MNDLFQKSDAEFMDYIVMPAALLFLAKFLGNIKMMMIPVLCILNRIFCAGVILYPIGLYADINNFAPSVMMTLIIAMSIYYSMFLISSYMEEMANGNSSRDGTKEAAIESMLQSSGHTILTSGMTLCACFLGMIILPQSIFQCVGIATSVGILSAVVVNLSLTPAILHSRLGEVFMKGSNSCLGSLCCQKYSNSGQDVVDPLSSRKTVNCEYWYGDTSGSSSFDSSGDDNDSYTLVYPLIKNASNIRNNSSNNDDSIEDGLPAVCCVELPECVDIAEMKQSFWYSLGAFLLQPKKGMFLLMCILGIALPIASYFPEASNSIAFELLLPTSSPSMKTFNELSQKFGPGYTSLYQIIFDGTKHGETVESEDAFQTMNSVINELVCLSTTTKLDSFSGISTLNGATIPFAQNTDAIHRCGDDVGVNASASRITN